ncbi:MAG: rod shape-determining protein MreC, partial [Bacteroidetes bacterium]
MRSLLEVLFRYGGFWTFLLLEGLSIYLVVQFNQHQRAIAHTSLNRFTGWVDQTTHAMQTFFRTRIYADSLAAENARLRQQLLELQMRYPPRTIRVESEEPAQAFQMQAARVLHNSIHRHHNYLVLDKGRRQGVEPHSAVVVDEGIVGIVRQVSEHYCLVMSVLNRQARISAAIEGKGFFGTLQW